MPTMSSDNKEPEKPVDGAAPSENKAEDANKDAEADGVTASETKSTDADKESDFHDAMGDDDDDKDDDDDDSAGGGGDKPTVKKAGKPTLSYREAREQKRLEANRVRARDRRKRDKVMWNQMQQKIVLLSQENNELKQRNQMLEAELGRVLRQQSVGGGGVSAQAQREAQLRGMMSPMDGMQQAGMAQMGLQRQPMSHLDALGAHGMGGGMPGGAMPNPGMVGMSGAGARMPGAHQGYGAAMGMPGAGAAGVSDMDRIRQQQMLDAQMMQQQQRMAQGAPPEAGQGPPPAGAPEGGMMKAM